MNETRTEYEQDGQLISQIDGTWQAVTKDVEGNAHIHTLEKHSKKVRPLPDPRSLISQAAPTIIKPSRRSIPETDFDTTLFIGDTQYPFENRRAMKIAMLAARALNPTTICWLGDDIDATNFSQFPSREEWRRSTQEGLDRWHEDISQFKADNPQSKLVGHESNHVIRLMRQIRADMPELENLRRAGIQHELGVLTVSFLMRFEELGFDYVTGYPNSAYWHEDNIKSFHGSKSVTRGSTMAAVIQNETVSCVQGHSHRAELIYRTFMDGRNERTIFGLNPGHMSNKNLLPSQRYATTERGRVTNVPYNWQSTIGLLHHTPERASAYVLPITEQGIDIFGKVYKS